MRWAFVLAVAAAVACGPKADEAKVVTITKPSAEAPFDRTFTWTAVPAATEYHLVVFSPTGDRTFEVRDLKTAGVKLAESVQLPPGKYSVQVTALRDGQSVAESPRTAFDIR